MHSISTMDPFEKILVPVDFSDDSTRAVERAAQVAPTGRIHLLHVTQPTAVAYPVAEIPVETSAMLYEPDETRRRMDDAELEKLEDLLKRRAPDARVSHRVTVGDPVAEILEESRDFDLIIMGACRRGRLSRLFLGSVAQKTARQADCPVLIERERAEQSHARG